MTCKSFILRLKNKTTKMELLERVQELRQDIELGLKTDVVEVSVELIKIETEIKQLLIQRVSKSFTAKDLKCPSCKKHCLMTYIDGKECTSCGYVCIRLLYE